MGGSLFVGSWLPRSTSQHQKNVALKTGVPKKRQFRETVMDGQIKMPPDEMQGVQGLHVDKGNHASPHTHSECIWRIAVLSPQPHPRFLTSRRISAGK